MIKYVDGGWWGLKKDPFFTRDHPEWKTKHPLGPLSFDYKCPECEYMIEDVVLENKDKVWQKMMAHWFVYHESVRIFIADGGALGDGDGI